MIYYQLNSFIGLDLFQNKEEWEYIVKYNRSIGILRLTGDLENSFNKSDYIIPMSGGRCKYNDGDPDWSPTQEKNTYQLSRAIERLSFFFRLRLEPQSYIGPLV